MQEMPTCAWIITCLSVVSVVNAHIMVTIPGLGVLKGRISADSDTVAFFGGVPFAKPPLGDLRWQSPQPHDPYTAPRDASAFGSSCVGSYSRAAVTLNISESEDCLFLNIFAPVASLNATVQLPVMVWIHGGGYDKGSSEFKIYSGVEFVAKSDVPIILVSVNYRLNAFGFLASHALQQQSSSGTAGNFGIEDQRLALMWIQDHIHAFGGDGRLVTIFGESAGGNSVVNHLTQPASFGLYTRAVIQSGTYAAAIPFSSAESTYSLLLNHTSCDDLPCLLKLSASKIITVVHQIEALGAKWGPVVDGISLPALPDELMSRGEYNKDVPVMLGSNRDEQAFWLAGHQPRMTEQEFDASFNRRYSFSTVAKIKELYHPSSYPYPSDLGDYSEWWWASMRIATDSYFGLGHCSARRVAQHLVNGGTPQVFLYMFEHPPQFAIQAYPGDAVPSAGPGNILVPHMSEIPFVLNQAQHPGATDQEMKLAKAMSTYWSHFAKSGDPNAPEVATLAKWPSYDPLLDLTLQFDVQDSGGIHREQGVRKHACDFWESRTEELALYV